MGFWIMIISCLIGLIFIILSRSKKLSKKVKYLLLVCGIVFILFAIFLATPQGADFCNRLNWIGF